MWAFKYMKAQIGFWATVRLLITCGTLRNFRRLVLAEKLKVSMIANQINR